VIGSLQGFEVAGVDEVEASLAGSAPARAQAFARLIDKQLEAAYRLATFMLGDRVEAEDATQEAAARAWQHFASLRDPSRFEAWFHRILINQCRDRVRARDRQASMLPLLSRDVHVPSAGSEERDALEAALMELTPEHRAVLALRYLADLPVAEIAKRTNTREGTVKSRLHYALRELRAAHDAALRTTRIVNR